MAAQLSCQMHSHMDVACSLVFWRLSARGLRDLDLLRNLMINLPSPWCLLSQPPPLLLSLVGKVNENSIIQPTVL